MSQRKLSLLSFLSVCALLLFSVYLQVYQNVLPCLLCTLQRLTFVALGLGFLASAIFIKRSWQRLTCASLTLLISGLGMGLAGRQIWLQQFPASDTGQCAMSLDYMIQVFSWSELFEKIFASNAECSKISWEFLNMDMAAWALISFSVFLLISCIQLFHNKN
jgi:disulfide bond formation protein DsbB